MPIHVVQPAAIRRADRRVHDHKEGEGIMSKAMKLSLLFALSLSASVAQAQAQTALIPKQLSGPPEEFAQMRAPDPAQSAVISKSALLPIELSGKSGAAISLPVENGKLRFALFSGGADWQPELASPSGRPLIAQKMAGGAKATRLGLDGNAYPCLLYTSPSPRD